MPDTPFGFDHPNDSPGYLFWQAFVTWQRRIKKALEPHGVSHAQFVIMAQTLWFEGNNHKASQALLGQWTKLDKMTVSKSLKKLAASGYIQRTDDEIDTRVKTTKLTNPGKKLVQKLVPLVEQIDEEFFSSLNSADRIQLQSTLRTLIDKNDETA